MSVLKFAQRSFWKKTKTGELSYGLGPLSSIWRSQNGLHEKPNQDLHICENTFSEWFSIEKAHSEIFLQIDSWLFHPKQT